MYRFIPFYVRSLPSPCPTYSIPLENKSRISNREIIIDSQGCSILQDLFIVLEFDRAVNGPFIPWREWNSGKFGVKLTETQPPRSPQVHNFCGVGANLREFSRSGLPYLRALTRSLARSRQFLNENPTGPYTGPFTPPFTPIPRLSPRGVVYNAIYELLPRSVHLLVTNSSRTS